MRLGTLTGHLRAYLQGRQLVRLKQEGDVHTFGQMPVSPGKVLRLEACYDPEAFHGAHVTVEAYDGNGERLARAKLVTRIDHVRRVFYSPDDPVTVQLRAERLPAKLRTHVTVRLEPIADIPKPAPELFGPNTVTAAMATYPGRAASYMDAINSLVGQVDNLMIYLNQYDQVPEAIRSHPEFGRKIHCILDSRGDKRAAAKFTWAHEPGYHLTCDDDIVYPPDYAERMIEAIERYGRQAIIGVHGITYQPVIEQWRQSRAATYRFREPLESDIPVHLIGTGTTAYHADTVRKLDWNEFLRYPISNDPLLAARAKRLGIPLVAISRHEDWMTMHDSVGFGIFEEKALDKSSGIETKILAKENPWPEPELPAVAPDSPIPA